MNFLLTYNYTMVLKYLPEIQLHSSSKTPNKILILKTIQNKLLET